MARPSLDPVVKITISMPRSLRERAQERVDQLNAPGFSQYLQHLISMDVHDAPNEIHYYSRTRDGKLTHSTLRVADKRAGQILRVAEDNASPYGPKTGKKKPQNNGKTDRTKKRSSG
jgi:hypothetical protein